MFIFSIRQVLNMVNLVDEMEKEKKSIQVPKLDSKKKKTLLFFFFFWEIFFFFF